MYGYGVWVYGMGVLTLACVYGLSVMEVMGAWCVYVGVSARTKCAVDSVAKSRHLGGNVS